MRYSFAAIIVTALLASCGGGGGESSSNISAQPTNPGSTEPEKGNGNASPDNNAGQTPPPSGSNNSTSPAVSSTTGEKTEPAPESTENSTSPKVLQSTGLKPISATSGKIELIGVATANFENQINLQGTEAKISLTVDPNLNAISLDQQRIFKANLSQSQIIEVEVSRIPETGVPVTLAIPDIIRDIKANQYIEIYYFQLSNPANNAEGGDGEDTIDPIDTNVDVNANALATIPRHAFQPRANGRYVAALKVGIATDSTSPKISAAKSRAIAAEIPLFTELICPLANNKGSGVTCKEISRFNEARNFDGTKKHHHPHKGMDIEAKSSLNLYALSGGVPIDGYTERQYQKNSKKSTGIALTLDYGSYQIRYFHLKSINPLFLLGDGSLNKVPSKYTSDGSIDVRAVLSEREVPVAVSGNTGDVPYHLHLEMLATVGQSCMPPDASKCRAATRRVDPFPYLASQINLIETSSKRTLITGSKYRFRLEAKDSEGTAIVSQVGNAEENDGKPADLGSDGDATKYEPTRKICLSPPIVDSFRFPDPDGISSFGGIDGSYCVPWAKYYPRNSNSINDYDVELTSFTSAAYATIIARYSQDASVSISADPLSSAVAALDFYYENDVKVFVAVNPPVVNAGQSAVYTWSSENATECRTGSGVFTTIATSGTYTYKSYMIGQYDFRIYCEGPNGNSMGFASLMVQ